MRTRADSPTKTCTTPECERPLRAKGLCNAHYKAMMRAAGAWHEPSQQWTPRRKANWRKRRALRKGAPRAETIYYDTIFRRDKYICQLCLEPVDATLVHPDLGSASLDHRVPLSLGGTHTRDNVQTTHLRCNLAKGRTDPRPQANTRSKE